MFGRFGTNYGQIFREGQPISAQQFNEELGKCITDVQVAEGSGLTLSRFGRRITINVDRQSPRSSVYIRISSATAITAGSQWVYAAIVQRLGGSEEDGLEDDGSTTYPAINTWETRFATAGYQNAGAVSLYQIPNGAVLPAKWSSVSGTAVFLFAERNEPTCD